MDKGLILPKWVLIVQPKNIPNALEFICPICLPKPKFLDFNEKKTSLDVGSPVICCDP